MKAELNRGIEHAVRAAFRVDLYLDAFEKLALLDGGRRLAPLFRRKIAADVAAAPLLFIHVPKNGGTSIKRSLYSSDPGHVTIRFYDWLDPHLLQRVASFALMREPFDRFLSGYDFLMRRGGSHVSIQAAAYRRLQNVRSIDMLIDYLESIDGDWFKVDTFLRPQWWFLGDSLGRLLVDRLWPLDHIAEVAALLTEHGFTTPAHINRTQRSEVHLSAAQKVRIERLYETDLILWSWVAACPGHGADKADCPRVPRL